MREDLLPKLMCPECGASLSLTAERVNHDDHDEVDSGTLSCDASHPHHYEIKDGILRMMTGFDHEIVQDELAYEEATYHGDEGLFDEAVIRRFPDSLPELWPHTRHFGNDFRGMLAALDPPSGAWALDVGTGATWSTRLLAERGLRAVAVDVNDNAYCGLGAARLYFDEYNVYYDRILESMNELPLRDQTMDLITFNASFHHSPDLPQTLRVCRRVLKDDGVIGMINESFIDLRHKLLGVPENDEGGSHRDVPYAEFLSVAREEGFDVEVQLAPHIEQKLLDSAMGRLIKPVLSRRWCVKQLNSALVVLRKAA